MKICGGCGQSKPLDDYYKRKPTGAPFRLCKGCNKERSGAWRKANPEKSRAQNRAWFQRNPEAARRIWLKKNYGITPEQYESMLKDQGGGCALCGKPERLHVDHCHKTGVVRGILCHNCNLGIGNLQEDQEILRRAMVYLNPSGPISD